MRHRPIVLRLLAALVIAFGLIGSVIAPTLAQDEATPTPEESSGDAAGEVLTADVLTGTLQIYYYLCDGGVGFVFDSSSAPGAGNPVPPDTECDLASAADGTDRTFYVYAFGDMSSTPYEVVTVDGVGTFVLPVTDGTPHTILEELPPAPEAVEEASHEPVEATFEIVADTVTGVNAVQFETGTLAFHTYICEGDPTSSSITATDPGETFDDTPYAECALGSQGFRVTPFGDDATYGTTEYPTVDGEGTANDVPATSVDSGKHTFAQIDSDLSVEFEIAAGETTVVYAVNYVAEPEPTGDLTVFKLTCVGEGETEFYVDDEALQDADAECVATVAAFSIYLFGDDEAEPISFETEEDGFKDILGLPVTDSEPHLLVEDATGAEVTFNVVEETTTVINVVNFEPPAPEDGTVEIEKLDCTGLLEPVIEVGEPGDDAAGVPENCFDGTASFLIYPFSDEEAEPIELTVESFDSVQLPPTDGTPHELVEVDGSGSPVATAYFDVESGNFTPVQVQNPTYGSVTIYSYLCEGDYDSWFEVFAPGESPDLPTDCDPLDLDVDIDLFQISTSETIGTGPDGVATVAGVPTTDAVGHQILMTGGVANAIFDVAPDETTYIVAYVLEPDDDDDDTDDSETVDDLPDTGTGPATQTGSAALLYGLLSVVTVVGLAALARRRTI